MPNRRNEFEAVLSAALKDMADHGYDSPARVRLWLGKLRTALVNAGVSEAVAQRRFRAAMGKIYDKARKPTPSRHVGLEPRSVGNIEYHLRPVFEARVSAGLNLIKLKRTDAIDATVKRFEGWATSLPVIPNYHNDLAKARKSISKPFRQMSYEDRRLTIDQSHKLLSAISQTIADQNGAVAGKWRHVHETAYDARPAHEARDGKVYLVRGSWAAERGLVKRRGVDFTDEITQPAEEPFCRCWWVWIYNLDDLPPELLTAKGRKANAI